MQQNEFVLLTQLLCGKQDIPQVLEYLKSYQDEEVAQAAQSLSGQFALAEVDGEQRVYHVSTQLDDDGNEQEYVEHIMNEGDDVIRFVAWFFDIMFDVKAKDTYQAAGKTYQQPKRNNA